MPVLPEGAERASIIEQLKQHGIEAGPGSVAGHLGQHFQPQNALPISENLHHQGLALPLYAGMTKSQVERVTHTLASLLAPTSPRATRRVQAQQTTSHRR